MSIRRLKSRIITSVNGLEFAPEEAVISWKGAFGSQRGFSDTPSAVGEE